MDDLDLLVFCVKVIASPPWAAAAMAHISALQKSRSLSFLWLFSCHGPKYQDQLFYRHTFLQSNKQHLSIGVIFPNFPLLFPSILCVFGECVE